MNRYSRRELFTRLFRPLEPARELAPEPGRSNPTRSPPAEWLPPYLRPPGAGPEPDFVAMCTGCGECTRACPEGAILPLGPAYGAAVDTPAILPTAAPCRLCPERPCAAVCEPGALRMLPLSEIQMGTLQVASERCWAAMGQPCDYCITACPLEAPALRATSSGVEFVEDACIGCGLCLFYCTATPRAIEIAPHAAEPS